MKMLLYSLMFATDGFLGPKSQHFTDAHFSRIVAKVNSIGYFLNHLSFREPKWPTNKSN